MFVRSAEGRHFFPLDKKLRLRADHWSEGAARVATRQGLQAKSFALAAAAYQDAVGCSMSEDSLRRVTEEWGELIEERRQSEAKRVYAPQRPEALEQVVQVQTPLQGQGNVSSDGGMVLLRAEGWKEVKMSVFSQVQVSKSMPTPENPFPESQVRLDKHSYQVGLWDADEMGQHQYLEGGRRQFALCQRLSSVNDGAVWIDRINVTNYPQAIQVIDWGHANERLWNVAKAAFGDGTVPSQTWARQQEDRLWHGRVSEVVRDLHTLNWPRITCSDDIRNSPDYFETRQTKMAYDQFRQAGYPIGSGTVESGINTVVHHRMKRQGRGWQRQHAQSMLAALGELHSGRFQSAWQTLS